MKTSKSDCAREPFTFDWIEFFDTHGLTPTANPITSSVWTISGGSATLGAESIADALTSVFVLGGTTGDKLAVENVIEIGGGTYRDCRTLFISVT